jgi:hypothetical protein
MRILVYVGWLMVALGVAFLVGGITQDQIGFGLIMFASMAGSGLFMVWLSRGWDKPLESSEELYKYGRPANATVRKVEDAKLEPNGTRTAKLSLHVTPRNESDYKTTQRVALPGGRVPAVGETVTIKFDPQSRRQFVLLEENFEVVDYVQQAGVNMQNAAAMMNQLAGPPKQ